MYLSRRTSTSSGFKGPWTLLLTIITGKSYRLKDRACKKAA